MHSKLVKMLNYLSKHILMFICIKKKKMYIVRKFSILSKVRNKHYRKYSTCGTSRLAQVYNGDAFLYIMNDI